MNKKLIAVVLLFTVISLSCNLLTNTAVPGETSGDESLTPGLTFTPSPIAQSQGITAESSSGGGVLITWEPINGADQYLLEIQVGDAFIPIAVLPAAQTSYQDENVPPATRFTYRLSSLVNSEKSDSKEITVETLPETISPLQVGLEFDTSSALLEIDPNNFDPNLIDPDNFDPSMFMPQPVESAAVIGPQGGEVSVTGSSGVMYTLVVPPNSLRAEVSIKLKPISAISDLPLSGGLMAAVFVEPDTLVFDIPAQLEMTPPADFAPAHAPLVLAFSFESEGQEFHLYPLAANAGQSRVNRQVASLQFVPNLLPPLSDMAKLQHGGGYGLGSGTVDDVKKVIKNPPAKSQNRTAQRLATDQIDELAPLTPIEDGLVPLGTKEAMQFAKMAEAILQKASQADDWSKFMEAVDDFSTYINAGGDEYYQGTNDKIFERLAAKAQALLQKNKGDCLTYDDFAAQDLVERLTNPKDRFSLMLSEKFKAKFGQKLLDEVAMGIKNCSFEFSMTSKLTFKTEGSTLTTTATTPQKIPLFLTYSKGEIFLWGGGEMKLQDLVTGICSFPLKQYDSLKFMIEKLSPIYENGMLTDFNLKGYAVHGWKPVTGIKSSEDKKGCPTMISLQGGGDFWTGLFIIARQNGSIFGWKLQNNLKNGNSLTATWKSVLPSFTPLGISGSSMTEDTTLELKVTKRKK